MLFNSAQFLIFLPIVILAYFILPHKIRTVWLLAASYYFYMCWDARFALLILFSTGVTYACGLVLEKIKRREASEEKDVRRKKNLMRLVMIVSLVINFGVLAYFKYTNFLLVTFSQLLSAFGVQIVVPHFDIMLPVGISFFTFQAVGYTIDVYRDDIWAERNFLRYALFVSFFPQLVAGPIERSRNLLKQLNTKQTFDFERAKSGILLMLWGFFLKIVMADRIGIFVDTVFFPDAGYQGWYVFAAMTLFGIQIYCDFYGYSIIAKGASRILGIELMENFNAPFLKESVAQFWRDWHISLTSWFKDYLYIPLGGSRKGKIRKHINRVVVFSLSGLWHGANMNFVLWGALNGIYQVIGDLLMPIRKWLIKVLHLNPENFTHRILRIVTTFILIDFGWILFRSHSLADAALLFHNLFSVNNFWIFLDGSIYTCGLNQKNMTLVLFCIGVLFVADLCKLKGIKISDGILKQDLWFQCLTFVFAVCFILIFGIWGPRYMAANFIYFQF